MRARRVVQGLVAVAAGVVLSAGDFVFDIAPAVEAQPPSAVVPDTPRTTRDAIAGRGRTADCLRCVPLPRCGDGNEPLEKGSAV